MKTKNTAPKRINKKQAKAEKKSSGILRIFSILMLLLMALSSFGRIASANHRTPPGSQTPTQQTASSTGGATAAQTFVFHRDDRVAGLCEDLVITSTGDAIHSTCGKGVEKQHTLSEAERQQLQTWIKNYQAVNYDHSAASQPDGAITQLYLKELGSQKATELEIQRMIDFAIALNTKIASQP